MKAYELIGEVNERGELRAQLPPDAPVGTARVLVLVPQDETVPQEKPEKQGGDWDELMRCIDANRMDTGIEDLAHEHDHYLHGTPKRGHE